jgi:hypothetical protein
MGVPYSEPKTPPLELQELRVSKESGRRGTRRACVRAYIVNVPPAMSSRLSFPSRA